MWGKNTQTLGILFRKGAMFYDRVADGWRFDGDLSLPIMSNTLNKKL